MLDLSPPILAILVCAATVLIALGVVGRIDRARPRCRTCGADARKGVTADTLRCACGTDLARASAVRWRRRRPWLVVVGSFLAIIAAVLGWVALDVRSRGPSWCVILPESLYEIALRRGWDGPTSISLGLVTARTTDPNMRRRYADAIVDRVRDVPGPLPFEAAMSIGQVIRGGLPVGRTETLIELLSRSITMDVVASASDAAPKLRVAQTDITSSVTGLLVRIDRVRVGDREIAWSLEPLRGTDAPDPTRWHQIWSKGIAVDLPADIDLTSDDIRHRLEVDCTMAIHRFARYNPSDDPVVATEPDPTKWGFDEIHGTFTLRGTAPLKPTAHAGTPWSELQRFADTRWGSISFPQPPVVAALPLLEALVLGLALGAFIVFATLLAARLRSPRCRLTHPMCRDCGSTVAADESLPPRCTECGRTIGGIDDVRWTAHGGWWRAATTWATALACIAVAAVALERFAAPRLRSFLLTAVATPEREVRWLVRATIAMQPYGVGPSASNRLSGGGLETQRARLQQSPELLRVAADEIVAWAKRGGTFPPSPIDPGADGRRAILHATLVQATSARLPNGEAAVSTADSAKALRFLLRADDLATAPSVVRVGQRIATDPTPWSQTMTDRFSMSSRCEPVQIDAPGLATVRLTTTFVATTNGDNDAILEINDERLLAAIPANAATVPRELATDAIASGSPMHVVLEEGGARDGVLLGNFIGRGILWVGRWDVLAPDGTVVGSLVTTPQGGEVGGVAALPDPWPDELVLRYLPNNKLPNGAPFPRYPNGALWNEGTQFRFVRGQSDRRLGTDAVWYRLRDAKVE